MVWVDWVILAFEQERRNAKNLNYEKEMGKLNSLKKQQMDEKISMIGELVSVLNGLGIPESLDLENPDSISTQLVTTLIEQLDGKLELKRDNGTEFIIRFTVTERDNQLLERAS